MNKHFGWLAFLSLSLISGTRGEETAVVKASKINVRGQPTLNSEVVTQLEKGDKVTIIEVIPDTDAKKNEPANWAKIKLPENTPIWLFAPFVKDGEVSVNRLNLRAGPGENYSVVGRVEKGAKVKTIRTVESWMEIEAPDDAYAFVGLNLLDRQEGADAGKAAVAGTAAATPAAAQAANQSKAPSSTTPKTATTQPGATRALPGTTPASAPSPSPSGSLALPGSRPLESKAPPVRPDNSTTTAAAATPAPTPAGTLAAAGVQQPRSQPTQSETRAPGKASLPGATAAPTASGLAATKAPNARPEQLPSVAEPAPTAQKERPKRVVRREGFVRPTRSIQAPTPFELVNAQSGKAINYLYGADIGVNLAEFRDMKVVVTGQEGIDDRWPNTPVLKLETIDTAP